ncbi:MAG: beta-ketoacyl-[acyl-carrier-protein] synthase family protein [Candidatus Omnitrophica bacterium]|nr:beta-ketoacyl-[acyl-carrier-protein] synthase family protein [Candidatus Omnitrophota bacterium]
MREIKKTKRRVVITGRGAITPLGHDVKSLAQAFKEGRSGQGPIQAFATENFPVKEAFEVKDFNPKKQGTQLLDPFIQYAVAAAEEAFGEAGFSVQDVDPFRVGIMVSSSKGGMHTIDRFKERFSKNPSAILGARIYCNSVPNFAAQWIARRWEIRGAAKCYIAACATGTVAIGEAARMVSEGYLDYCIAGASDASVVPLMLAGYNQMKALSPSSILPFHQNRSGFMVGEGSGIVFLETLESAQARGAKIFGEVLGYKVAGEGTDTIHFRDETHALSRLLQNMMEQCDVPAANLDYVNLHGTATKSGDLYETRQLKKAFGKDAVHISMSSTKSMTGHLLGAAGAVEVIGCLIAMDEGFIPPTIGLDRPDAECDLDYTALKSRTKKVNRALSISLGFGGHLAAIALGKV